MFTLSIGIYLFCLICLCKTCCYSILPGGWLLGCCYAWGYFNSPTLSMRKTDACFRNNKTTLFVSSEWIALYIQLCTGKAKTVYSEYSYWEIKDTTGDTVKLAPGTIPCGCLATSQFSRKVEVFEIGTDKYCAWWYLDLHRPALRGSSALCSCFNPSQRFTTG